MKREIEQLEHLKKAAKVLKIISHPIRLALVNILLNAEKLSVGEIQKRIGVSQSMTSQHLAALKSVGIVVCEKQANVCFYYVENKHINKLLNCVNQCA